MKTTITIEFESEDAEKVAELTGGVDLTILLRDALGEFIAARTPALEYVKRRYDASYIISHRLKVREVEKRCKLADVLKHGNVTIELDRTEP